MSNLFHALNAASSGFRVFPCDPKTQKSLIPNFLEDATTDPDAITEFWKKFPDAIPGLLPKQPLIAATSFTWIDPATIPRRRFIYGTHYIRQFVSTTVAPGGVGKSSLSIVEGLAIASGKPLLGIRPAERGRVWLYNGEDPIEELQRRIMAAAVHFELSRSDFEGRLFVDSGRSMPVVIAEQTRDGAVINTPVVKAVISTIEDNGIDVAIIDPFVSSHHVTENDNNAIERVAKTWAKIADETRCAIDLVHHSRKTNGAEVTVEDGRGASALLSAARSARVLNGMTVDEAEKAGVENRRLYFRVDNGKSNLAPPVEAAQWFQLVSTDLGNGSNPPKDNDGPIDSNLGAGGDKVGVVTAWQWPNPFDDITVADLRAAQTTVAAGGLWRENFQASDWIGKPIATALRLDPANKAHARKIKGLLKTWIAEGMFVRVTGRDAKRNERTFIEVGQWATD